MGLGEPKWPSKPALWIADMEMDAREYFVYSLYFYPE